MKYFTHLLLFSEHLARVSQLDSSWVAATTAAGEINVLNLILKIHLVCARRGRAWTAKHSQQSCLAW